MRTVATLLLAAIIQVCLLAATPANAILFRGQVQPSMILQHYFPVGPGGRAIAIPVNVTRDETTGMVEPRQSYEALISRDGSFIIDLPDPSAPPPAEAAEGTLTEVPKSDVYLLRFRVRELKFRDYRVDVRSARRAGQPPIVTARLHDPSYPISSALYMQDPLPLPLMVSPKSRASYFQSIQDFNALNYLLMTLKSPMILMAVAAWAMVTLLPKLTASLDPEEARELQKQQADMAKKMSALQSGDWKSMLGSGESAGSSGVQAGSAGQARKRN